MSQKIKSSTEVKATTRKNLNKESTYGIYLPNLRKEVKEQKSKNHGQYKVQRFTIKTI